MSYSIIGLTESSSFVEMSLLYRKWNEGDDVDVDTKQYIENKSTPSACLYQHCAYDAYEHSWKTYILSLFYRSKAEYEYTKTLLNCLKNMVLKDDGR